MAARVGERPGRLRRARRRASTSSDGRYAAGATAAGCTALRVDLPAPLEPGASATVRLRLRRARPAAQRPLRPFRRALLLGNAIPVLAPEDVSGPRLVPYSGLGDSFYSLTAAWRLVLDVPAGLEVAATGTETAPREPLPDGGWRIVSEAPAARDLAIAVGPFAVAPRQVGNVEVRVLRLRGRRPRRRAPHAPGRARRRRSYTSWFGRSGVKPGQPMQLDVVQTRFADFGGMEYPELVIVVDDPTSVAHEVAHQWFYGLVGSDEWREPWLDESLATFAQRRLPRARLLRARCASRSGLAGARLTSTTWRSSSGIRSCTARSTTAEPVPSRRCAARGAAQASTPCARTGSESTASTSRRPPISWPWFAGTHPVASTSALVRRSRIDVSRPRVHRFRPA